MNTVHMTLGDLYSARDRLKAKIDLRNGSMLERAALLKLNGAIAARERERRGETEVKVPLVMRWKRRSVWV